MSVDHNELHELIDQLPDEQLALAVADLRRRTQPPLQRTQEPFAWIGMITDGPSDASMPERIDKELAKGFGRS